MPAWKAQRQNRGREHKRRRSPQATLESRELEDKAGEQGAKQPPPGIRHVVEADVQSHAILIRVGQHQIGMDRRVNRKNHREDSKADHERQARGCAEPQARRSAERDEKQHERPLASGGSVDGVTPPEASAGSQARPPG